MKRKVLVAGVGRKALSLALLTAIAVAGCGPESESVRTTDWQPAPAALMTRWARDVSPDHAWPEYPRPQLVRDRWANLNGLWDYAIRPRAEGRPETFDGRILVPFPVESALSGVMRPVGADARIWYRRTVRVPWSSKLLLHFEAVDWEATVWVNGRELGTHRGGYDAFAFELPAEGDLEIVVAVWDPTDSGTQPRGKQVNTPNGIFYTATSGIWQTVWLEPVADEFIHGVHIVPALDRVTVTVDVPGRVELAIGALRVEGNGGEPIEVLIPEPKLWSPDSPYLYDLEVRSAQDVVKSYFGLRTIAVADGRLVLNGQPLFQYGPLDQGFWPDGLYTPPGDAAMRSDLEVTKQLGFNAVRKHVKVESDRWYYWCDKLGLLVWQDMPSGDKYVHFLTQEIQRTPESAQQFELELKRMIDGRYNHPSIVMWVLFNEGWGQYATQRLTEAMKRGDPTRLVNAASGWNDLHVGDVIDSHIYPGPGAPKPGGPDRPGVLGEFGGLGLTVSGHTWLDQGSFSYVMLPDAAALEARYLEQMEALRRLIAPGLAAAIYTQTTDVEGEVNGLMTYDRAVIKVDPARVAAAHRALYAESSGGVAALANGAAATAARR
jgi:beta-galactosidase/beta-glucuronidase